MDAFQIVLHAATSHSDWWTGWVGAVLGALFGTTVGSCIPVLWARHLRRLERKGELVGMLVELRLAQLYMDALLKDGVASPLYRLPLSMFERGLPKLIGDGKLTTNEIGLLVEYVNRIEELNRGLDRAGEASKILANDLAVAREHERNILKAEDILSAKLTRHDDQSLFDGARGALLWVDEFEKNWSLRLWGRVRMRMSKTAAKSDV
jgi:hypothetical protein